MTIDEELYAVLKKKFLRECRRVENYKRRKLTSNATLRLEYRTNLTRTYNELTSFLHRTHLNSNFFEKLECQNRQITNKRKLKEAFNLIKVRYEFSNTSFNLIDLERVIEVIAEDEIESEEEVNEEEEEENVNDSIESTLSNDNELNETIVDQELNDNLEENSEERDSEFEIYASPLSRTQSFSELPLGTELNDKLTENLEIVSDLNRTLSFSEINKSPIKIIQKARRLTQFLNIDNELNRRIMAFEYISNVSRIIKNPFNGDSTEVDAFIASIELADSASAVNDQPNLVKFIRTKLTGPAVDYVPATTATAADAVRLIRDKVKGDNTQVVMGRLLALRSDKNSLQKFQEQAEELAEKLKKSYINDGIPHDVANKMTIDKTVEMCRLSARTPLVKSVLASTKFDEPKEVLAKFITEAATENTEVKILSFRNNNNNRGNRQYNNRGQFNNRGGYNRGNFNNNRNYGYNNQNNHNNFNRGRGRGRGRGGGYRNFNGQNNYQNNYGNRNERNVRVIQENQLAPTQERGGNQNVQLREA